MSAEQSPPENLRAELLDVVCGLQDRIEARLEKDRAEHQATNTWWRRGARLLLSGQQKHEADKSVLHQVRPVLDAVSTLLNRPKQELLIDEDSEGTVFAVFANGNNGLTIAYDCEQDVLSLYFSDDGIYSIDIYEGIMFSLQGIHEPVEFRESDDHSLVQRVLSYARTK